MKGNQQNFAISRRTINLLLIAGLTITVIGFVFDFNNTITYIGSDLRNRVVAARLILEGIDPYFFRWVPSFSDRFYDPLEEPGELLSKVSVPPTVLAFHTIIAKLSYLQQKIIWLFCQWIAFISTVLIFLKASESRSRNYLILAVGFFLPIVCFGVFTLTQDRYIYSTFCYWRSLGFY